MESWMPVNAILGIKKPALSASNCSAADECGDDVPNPIWPCIQEVQTERMNTIKIFLINIGIERLNAFNGNEIGHITCSNDHSYDVADTVGGILEGKTLHIAGIS